MKRRVGRVVWVLAAVLLAAVVARAFFFGVYRVTSPSMEPTIHGSESDGEWVLVRFDRAPELERFDLVVVRSPDGGTPLVKRVVGLPGETVLLSMGDLLIDGRRLEVDAFRPQPVPIFDVGTLDVEEHFALRSGPEGPWSRDGAAWRLDARAIEPDSDAGMMLYERELRDGWLGDAGSFAGVHPVDDAEVECVVTLEEVQGGGRLVLRLVEAGDTFELVLLPTPDGPTTARITRRNAVDGHRVMAEGEVRFERDEPVLVRFANVDNHLRLDLGEVRGVLASSYDRNAPHRPPGGAEPPPGVVTPRRTWAHPVGLGGDGVAARFEGIRIVRDLWYTPRGRFAVREPLTLGPDEIFLLGDNSGASVDGRHWGPVEVDRVLGRPRAVVWPPGRARRL
jgi:signal peptidase I